MTVRVTFLGGLGGIGRNCATLEVDGKIAVIDCGLMFPEEEMLGVDLVFPTGDGLWSVKQDLVCVILTHGHRTTSGVFRTFSLT